jgi:hypothetical protein
MSDPAPTATTIARFTQPGCKLFGAQLRAAGVLLLCLLRFLPTPSHRVFVREQKIKVIRGLAETREGATGAGNIQPNLKHTLSLLTQDHRHQH